MHCKQCQKLVFNYIDGALGDRQKALIDAHLENCRDCRAYMAFEQQMRRIFPEAMTERLNELTLSPEVRRNVINAVKPAVEKKLWLWIGIRRPVWALAAGIMLAIISASLYWMGSMCQKQVAVDRFVAGDPPPPVPNYYITSNEFEERMELTYNTQEAFILKEQQVEYIYTIQKDHDECMNHEDEIPYWESGSPGNAFDDISEDDLGCRDDPGSAGFNNQFNNQFNRQVFAQG